MESKRQSKLPEGLGKKIIQALKTQSGPTPAKSPGVRKPDLEHPQIATPVDEHGLETISHMDFGTQEMYYDPPEAQYSADEFQYEDLSSPGFETPAATSMPVQTPQYGSFDVMQQDYGSGEPDLMTADYSPSSYGDYDYNQQTYDNLNYDQQSYETYDQQSYAPQEQQEEFSPYQPPRLGASAGATPAAVSDYEEFNSNNFDYEQETRLAPLDDSFYPEEGYSPNMTETPFEGQSYEPTLESYDSYSTTPQIGYSQQDLVETSTPKRPGASLDLDAVAPPPPPPQPVATPPPVQQPQVASNIPELESQDLRTNEDKSALRSKRKSGERLSRAEAFAALPPVEYSASQETAYTPEQYNLAQQDLYSQEGNSFSNPQTNRYQQPEAIYSQHDEHKYSSEPDRDYRRQDSYQQPQYNNPERDYRHQEEKYYQQEDHKRPDYRYEERYDERYPARYDERYNERPVERNERYDDRFPDYDRGPSRGEERYYREPERDYRYQEERYYQGPERDYYRDEPRRGQMEPEYRGDTREYRDPRDAREGSRDPKSPRMPGKGSEAFNSNVETLTRLVTSLPPGVTKQTGAQIIRQTMEAMGISMNEVLADAQEAHNRLHKFVRENINKIEEQRNLIKRMEDDIHNYQRKAKELDDIIGLFIMTDKKQRGSR